MRHMVHVTCMVDMRHTHTHVSNRFFKEDSSWTELSHKVRKTRNKIDEKICGLDLITNF